MGNKEQEVGYDVYLRKSSEAEDKQVQSIDDQRREMREFAEKNHLKILEEFEESQSAHTPGRPVFNEIVRRIKKGISNGLLVWHANRISRNPVDSGTIINLIDEGRLIHVKTPSHVYGNDPTEKMMLALECMLAKKDSDDKSHAVKRGLRGRYIKGYPSGVAPMGFLNDMSREKGDRGWKLDKEKFDMVKQLLDLFATGRYSIRKLLEIANEQMGMRTTIHKKQGGKKLVLSYITKTILKNPVFAGFFFSKDGTRHELMAELPRAISEDQYWHIQKIMGNKGRPRPYVNRTSFAYVGLANCGGCGGSVTAEHKYQLICPECKFKFSYPNKEKCPKCDIVIDKMEGATYLHYIYYHCTKRKNPNCKEGSIQEIVIDQRLSSYFKENLKISNALSEWCIENLNGLEKSDQENDYERKTSVQTTLLKKENEYKELILMKTKGLLNDEDFIQSKQSFKEETDALKQQLRRLEHVNPDKMKKACRAFDLAKGIDEIFANGSTEEKKETLSEIGSNLTLKDKNINVSNNEIYSAIINGLLSVKAKNPLFEPENIIDTSSSNEDFMPIKNSLLGR